MRKRMGKRETIADNIQKTAQHERKKILEKNRSVTKEKTRRPERAKLFRGKISTR